MDSVKLHFYFFLFKRFNKVSNYFYNKYCDLLHEQQRKRGFNRL